MVSSSQSPIIRHHCQLNSPRRKLTVYTCFCYFHFSHQNTLNTFSVSDRDFPKSEFTFVLSIDVTWRFLIPFIWKRPSYCFNIGLLPRETSPVLSPQYKSNLLILTAWHFNFLQCFTSISPDKGGNTAPSTYS